MAKIKEKKIKSTLLRPPVVAVLGHIDHGKTSLLDAIRSSNQVKREFGGITQHIGAYQVEVKVKEGTRKITFIDTPGHEAFNKVRSRGAQVTDLVVLVINAVEGIKPQTEECLRHIEKAKVPFIVAASKMDLPEANVNRVKKHLAKLGIVCEDQGGEVVVVPVSAVSKSGIDQLLEMILLVSEMKGLKGSIDDPFQAVVIESELDRKKGPMATILVKQGSLKKGDDIFLGEEKTRIRVMFDESGNTVDLAKPSKPVVVLGFNKVPPVGSVITKEVNDKQVNELVKKEVEEEGEQLKVILKADTLGTLEAIMEKLGDNINIIDFNVGDIGSSDILKAQTSKAVVIGFNVRVGKNAKVLAQEEKVLIKTYNIIYKLLEEIDEVAKIIFAGDQEEILGEGQIIDQFDTSEGKIAGIKVVSGKFSKGDKVKLVRKDETVSTGKIISLRQEKEEVNKVEQGVECGAKLSTNLDFLVSDMLLSFKVNKGIKLE